MKNLSIKDKDSFYKLAILLLPQIFFKVIHPRHNARILFVD